jgi:EAL domain-containing protein (putative c-di-GMP-specific phosphodiesterase class I)
MNVAIIEKMTLEKSLRAALDRGQLSVYYQPRVNLVGDRIMGMEALVRWHHPDLGTIPPVRFIPLAEETGLIIPLTGYVLHEACRQNKQWQDAGFHSMDIAVNISACHFQQGDLVNTVKQVLEDTGLDPQYLDLEITESSLMQNPELAIKSLQELKGLGIRISVDDFGTGYSSLSYLKKFPVDTVKIDQSFVHDITSNSDDAAIAAAVVAMAHSLKLKVVAEGVETLGQLEFLRSLECDEMQGYFISRPAPSEDIIQLLSKAEQRDKAA